MINTLKYTCLSALLCGAVLAAAPAFGAGVGGSATGAVGGAAGSSGTTTDAIVDRSGKSMANAPADKTAAGASTSVGVSASGDVNNTDTSNNAGSINRSTQRMAGHMSTSHMSKRATAAANQSEAETTRQLNQQQGSVSAGGSATVQQ